MFKSGETSPKQRAFPASIRPRHNDVAARGYSKREVIQQQLAVRSDQGDVFELNESIAVHNISRARFAVRSSAALYHGSRVADTKTQCYMQVKRKEFKQRTIPAPAPAGHQEGAKLAG